MRLVVMGKDGQEAILEEGSASYEGYLQMGYVFVREYQPQGEAGDAVEATEAATEPTTQEEPVTAPVLLPQLRIPRQRQPRLRPQRPRQPPPKIRRKL